MSYLLAASSVLSPLESEKGNQTELLSLVNISKHPAVFNLPCKDDTVSQLKKACINNKPLHQSSEAIYCMGCDVTNLYCDQMQTIFHIPLHSVSGNGRYKHIYVTTVLYW